MELQKIIYERRKLLLPFLLSVLLSAAVFSVYGISFFSVYTLGSAIIAALSFAVGEFTNKHHLSGGVIVVVMSYTALRLFVHFAYFTGYGFHFSEWFLTGASEIDTQTTYLLSLLALFPYFFSICIYYFSVILYRSTFLMLISIIPCTLYVKVLSEMDNVYIALIASLNLAILVSNNSSRNKTSGRSVGGFTSIFSAAVFIFSVLIFSSIIPKENNARYYDKFERIFMSADAQVRFAENFSNFSQYSGNADRYNNFRNSLMYTVYADEQLYLRRQTFDLYDNYENRWTSSELYSLQNDSSAESYCDKIESLSLGKMQEAVKKAAEYDSGFAEKYGLTKLVNFRPLEEQIRYVQIYAENFPAVFYLSPVRTIDISQISHEENKDIRTTKNGIFKNQFNDTMHSANTIYQVAYYGEMDTRFYWFELGGANFTKEDYHSFLEELMQILSSNGETELWDTAFAFLNDYYSAADYHDYVLQQSDSASEAIAELAHQLTDGYKYDWEKANALQDYFQSTDYVYNLQYTPPTGFDTPEYFIFTSKTGTCSDFATAFTLMARAAGLTVRYTEGFAPDITATANKYVIRDSCSHAYPEVYIPNMGWIVFEPTVASLYNNSVTESSDNGIQVDYNLIFTMSIIAFIVLTVMGLAIFFYPAISEGIYAAGIRKADCTSAVKRSYAGIVRVMSGKAYKAADKLTPRELFKALDRLSDSEKYSPYAEIVEAVCYNELTADEECKEKMYRCYSEAIKDIKIYSKQKRKTKMKGR
ncbi:MAG: transglutaminase family protein [Oscillospiraceae bacterium]